MELDKVNYCGRHEMDSIIGKLDQCAMLSQIQEIKDQMRGFVKHYDFNDAAIDIEKLKSAVKLFIKDE